MKKNKLWIILLAVVVLVGGGYYGYRQMFGVKKVVVAASEQMDKISEYANPSAFITPLQLKELIDNQEDVVVIGALDPIKGDAPIAGSFTMWRPDYSAAQGVYDFGGMRNTIEETEAILSGYGVTPDTTIVVYASNAHHDAARLWWQFKLLGHEDVRYLDGGLNAWVGAGYPTGGGNPTVEATNYKAPNPSEMLIASFDDVVAALGTDTVIIDTRGAEEEDGSTTLSGAFGPGKIPGAVWIEWTEALNEDTTLKSKNQLQALYGDLEDKKVITYCQSGVRSAHTLLVLTQVLGYEDVMNYDGSWIEWSYEHYENNNPLAQVENGN
ncbi:sulfurtransferase [Natronincola ferrireducens]|uniref:Sulfurtransferase n=1 Tax=Natronincola ferrireducens TaxID=393762 RepID=A0A1G9EHU0_9FIRM|nr:rhodanese-like domain-containing protein [Natronincola ferrireducens]SDK75712.1 thiosulfate/3-mercaptopyruvate sulfurtransferase [Natronincola ferrireducens]